MKITYKFFSFFCGSIEMKYICHLIHSRYSVNTDSNNVIVIIRFHSWGGGEIRWRKDKQPTPVFLGFPCGSAGKESSCNAGDLGFIPRLGRSPGEGEGNPFQYPGLENSMNCIIHGVAKSQTQLSNFHFHC